MESLKKLCEVAMPHYVADATQKSNIFSWIILTWIYPTLKANNQKMLIRSINSEVSSSDFDFVIAFTCETVAPSNNCKTFPTVDAFVKSKCSEAIRNCIWESDGVYFIPNHIGTSCLLYVFASLPVWGKAFLPEQLPEHLKECLSKIVDLNSYYTTHELEHIIKEYCEPYISEDLKERAVSCKLAKIQNVLFEVKVAEIKNKIITLEAQIEQTNLELFGLAKTLRNTQMQSIALLSSGEDKSLQELTSFLSSSHSIELVDVLESEARLQLQFTGSLNNFDTKLFTQIRNTRGSYINKFETQHPEMTELLSEIFVTKKYSINQFSSVLLYLSSDIYQEIVTCKSVSPDECSRIYLPNIHMSRYNCLGEYGAMISRAYTNGDYIAICNLLLNLTCSLNLADTTVASQTLKEIYNRRFDLILQNNETGELVSPDSVINRKELENG